MSFSYGRALQQSALRCWGKNQDNTDKTQKIFDHRSKMNSLATNAEWTEELENRSEA
jgi:fructose-bisphosphate aldolase class I